MGSVVTAVGWGLQDFHPNPIINYLAYLDKNLADCASLAVDASAQDSGISNYLCYQTSADTSDANDGGAYSGDSGGKLAKSLKNVPTIHSWL